MTLKIWFQSWKKHQYIQLCFVLFTIPIHWQTRSQIKQVISSSFPTRIYQGLAKASVMYCILRVGREMGRMNKMKRGLEQREEGKGVQRTWRLSRLVGNLTYQVQTKQPTPGSYDPSCANYITLVILFSTFILKFLVITKTPLKGNTQPTYGWNQAGG